MSDLVVLVADKNTEYAIRGILDCHHSLGVRKLSCDIFVHSLRDPGCRLRGDQFLAPFSSQYSHAIIVFDREGCGDEDMPRTALELDLEERLSLTGWSGRAAAIVVDPELEAWVWSDSPIVERVLGWSRTDIRLREWLEDRGFLVSGGIKPTRPKEAVESVLRQTKKRRSSAIYAELARHVSLNRCEDASFAKLRSTLSTWFPKLQE